MTLPGEGFGSSVVRGENQGGIPVPAVAGSDGVEVHSRIVSFPAPFPDPIIKAVRARPGAESPLTATLLIVTTAVIGVLLTVAGIAGVWLAMRTGQNTQTVKNFRDAAASWREKAEALGSDLVTLQGELASLRTEHDKLQTEHESLKNVVTGKAALEALGVQMDAARSEIILEVRLNRGVIESLESLMGEGHAKSGS